jgi:hypothetical protein
VRELYSFVDFELAGTWIDELIRDMNDPTWPLEVRSLGRTLKNWRAEIIAWHKIQISNGPTEGQQFDQASQARGLRLSVISQLPRACPSLHREARLVETRDGHTPLSSEAPYIQWGYSKAHKRITCWLTPEQAEHYRPLVERGRQFTNYWRRLTGPRPVELSVPKGGGRKRAPQKFGKLVHWVRDVTFDEDRFQVRAGIPPCVLATLRNLAISAILYATSRTVNIVTANRQLARQSDRTLDLLGNPPLVCK